MSEQQTQELDLNGEMIARREKLATLRARGNAFPNTFRRDAYLVWFSPMYYSDNH